METLKHGVLVREEILLGVEEVPVLHELLEAHSLQGRSRKRPKRLRRHEVMEGVREGPPDLRVQITKVWIVHALSNRDGRLFERILPRLHPLVELSGFLELPTLLVGETTEKWRVRRGHGART